MAASGGLFPTQVVVHGLDELIRDFGKLSKKARRELQKELRHLAEPAADLIRREAAGHNFSERSVSGIRAGSRVGTAVVRETRDTVTGKRPDYGSTLYRYAFLPGAEQAEPVVEKGVEEWLGKITSEVGLGGGGIL
jgi:hypothetical protein